MRVLTTVFSRLSYAGIAVIIASGVISASVWFPNLELIVQVLSSKSVPVVEKFHLMISFYSSLQTNFTLVGAVSILLISILLGMNAALLLFYVRKMHIAGTQIRKAGSVSVGGFVSGIFGIGCASCGTFIATSLFASLGGGMIIPLFPFGGEAFGFLGVMLLLWSQYLLIKHIKGSNICSI